LYIGREINKAEFKSRWDNIKKGKNDGFNEPHDKTFTPMPFCYLPKGKTMTELEILILRHRLEDVQKRLAVGDFEINDPDLRSPSPEIAYDAVTGEKTNSREIRHKERYTTEKNFIVEELLKLDNNFIAPADYKPPMKKRKIYFDDPDMSDTNYIGLIIGPGGKTQKDLEKRSKCKISIRGKGSNNKSRVYNKKENDEREELHVLVESQNDEDLEIGERLVKELLDPSSDHKKNQLIEIAALRGTLRDDWCEDCGQKGHRRFECPNKVNSWKKVNIQCEVCGQTTHPTRDCPTKREDWNGGISVEDDLEEFLDNLKNKKKMLTDGEAREKEDENKPKDNAFENAAKTVVKVIEKEAPGYVSKDIKDKIQPWSKREGAEIKDSDRVVAVVDNSSTQIALNGKHAASANPLLDLHNKFTDNYGKLLATEAVNFYNNYVQPRESKSPAPTNYSPPLAHAVPNGHHVNQPPAMNNYQTPHPSGPPGMNQPYYPGYPGGPPFGGPMGYAPYGPPMRYPQYGQPPGYPYYPQNGHPGMYPPMGAPPMGAPSMGAPSMGAPPTGAPPTGAPPTGAPPTGAPIKGAPPMGYYGYPPQYPQ
jgi:hypothetical protein